MELIIIVISLAIGYYIIRRIIKVNNRNIPTISDREKTKKTHIKKLTSPSRPLIDLSSPLFTKNIQDFNDLKLQLDELAKKAWTTEKVFQSSEFCLKSIKFSGIYQPEQVIEIFLRHAEKVTPGFSIPSMIPQVIIESIPFAAGCFKIDEEGWVTIKLSQNFFQDKFAAQAIMAHEVCHYILENSGIRHNNFEINERYTDLCMFVCGFGEIFLEGYKREAAQSEYRLGHRLGYLTDAEYQFASQYINLLRQSNTIKPPSELDTLKKKLGSLLYGDKNAQRRLIQLERRRNPHKSEEELYQNAIERLERDRGR